MREQDIVGYAWKASRCWWMEHWARKQSESFRIGEAFAADPQAADAVLAACRLWSLESGGQPVALAIPMTAQVGAAARMQNADVLHRYSDEAEFMGRSTGLVALLRSMRPELEEWWRPVSGSMPSFAMTIVTEGERATVIGNEQGIEIDTSGAGDIEVTIDSGSIARLALGGFDPCRVLERLCLPSTVTPVLTTLFPQRFPYLYPVDRF